MIDLIRRAAAILHREGVTGLLRSTGAYAHNQFLFDLRIRARSFLYTKRGHKGLDRPYDPIWIDPNRIQLVYEDDFNQKKRLGSIKSGTWDKQVYSIDDSPTYIGLKERFCEGYDWEQTTYYEYKTDKLKSQSKVNDYYSVSQFEERLNYLDQLYENIRKRGYKSQQELNNEDWDSIRHPVITRAHQRTGEVGVNIGREGELIQNDGIHRLSIARILDINKIPIQIIVRHKEWQETRNEILTKGRVPDGYRTHPDISNF